MQELNNGKLLPFEVCDITHGVAPALNDLPEVVEFVPATEVSEENAIDPKDALTCWNPYPPPVFVLAAP